MQTWHHLALLAPPERSPIIDDMVDKMWRSVIYMNKNPNVLPDTRNRMVRRNKGMLDIGKYLDRYEEDSRPFHARLMAEYPNRIENLKGSVRQNVEAAFQEWKSALEDDFTPCDLVERMGVEQTRRTLQMIEQCTGTYMLLDWDAKWKSLYNSDA